MRTIRSCLEEISKTNVPIRARNAGFGDQLVMKCKNKTASCNDETCPFDEMFGLKEDPPSQE